MIADLPTRGLLPVPEVARLLGVSPRYVRDRVKAGELEGYALAARRFSVSVASLRRFLEQRRLGA